MEALLRSMQRTMENFVEFMKVTAEGFETLGNVIQHLHNSITTLQFWCGGLSVWCVVITILMSYHILSTRK